MEKRYYRVEAKCGHVGRGRCVWVTFATVAEDGKEAARRVRGYKRVKHDHKDAIRLVEKISFEEFVAIKAANDIDPYLHCKNVQEQRRIPGFDERVVEDAAEAPVEKRRDRHYHRRLLELELREASAAIHNYYEVGEYA